MCHQFPALLILSRLVSAYNNAIVLKQEQLFSTTLLNAKTLLSANL